MNALATYTNSWIAERGLTMKGERHVQEKDAWNYLGAALTEMSRDPRIRAKDHVTKYRLSGGTFVLLSEPYIGRDTNGSITRQEVLDAAAKVEAGRPGISIGVGYACEGPYAIRQLWRYGRWLSCFPLVVTFNPDGPIPTDHEPQPMVDNPLPTLPSVNAADHYLDDLDDSWFRNGVRPT